MYDNAIEKTSIEKRVEQLRANKNYVTIKEIPKNMQLAMVSVEDRRFYTHSGIDIISIGRAVITDIKAMSLVAGGSTITQQLAKNMYFTMEKKFERKVAEIFVAFDLEKKYSKDDILELYLNVVYFGDGHYGIKEAAQGYFNKEPKELSLEEITVLAGLPNAPSAYELSNKTALTKQRQNIVIDAMLKYGNPDEALKKELEALK